MESKSANNIYEAVLEFARSVGLADWLISDGKSEFVGKRTDVQRFLRKNNVDWRATKRDKEYLSKADERIHILMTHTKRLMVQCDVPKRLWSFARKYEIEILNWIWQSRLDRTPEEVVVGFYEWCWY